MLTTTLLPAFGLAVEDDRGAFDVFAEEPASRGASFGGCGCMSAEVGEAAPTSGQSTGSSPATSQAPMAPTVNLAVGLIVGAVVLLLIAAA